MRGKHFETLAVRAGQKPDPTTGAILPPIYQTATYVLEEVGKNKGFDYSRASNPTRQNLEEALAALEGAAYGVAFASGLASVDAFIRLFNPGDHIVASEDMYGGVTRLFEQILKRYGLTFTYVDTSHIERVPSAIQPNTRVLWVETPSNPLLRVTDLEKGAAIAKEHQLLFAVDSTFATPYHLKPMEYGADAVIQSTTKYLSGHNTIIGGAVLVNDPVLYEKLKFFQKAIGAVPGPMDCFLTHLGLKTLPLRMAKHSENALKVARYLEKHPKVAKVIYPGLESHPQHTIAKAQMKQGFSGMVSFELKGGTEAGRRLMNSVRLCSLAESLGAVETMITHPATMTHADIPKEVREAHGITDGLVRLSVGIEHPDDILEDLEQALEKA